jgi:hypothetical protein
MALTSLVPRFYDAVAGVVRVDRDQFERDLPLEEVGLVRMNPSDI